MINWDRVLDIWNNQSRYVKTRQSGRTFATAIYLFIIIDFILLEDEPYKEYNILWPSARHQLANFYKINLLRLIPLYFDNGEVNASASGIGNRATICVNNKVFTIIFERQDPHKDYDYILPTFNEYVEQMDELIG